MNSTHAAEKPICPICGTDLKQSSRKVEGCALIDCQNCGTYRISREALDDLSHWRTNNGQHLPVLAHRIRQLSQVTNAPLITETYLMDFFKSPPKLPSATEQIENLICWLGETLDPGDTVNLEPSTCQAVVGAKSDTSLAWVLETALGIGWVEGIESNTLDRPTQIKNATLSITGWQWYEETGKHKQSRRAFMAMPFGNNQLDEIMKNHFRPAVEQTGLELFRLDDRPEAGSIDNRLRVEIRKSRLLIADVTHQNIGAIWEAGFAEGLGKPVIYTCEKSAVKGQHFDIRNLQMVVWDSSDPQGAAEQLKATIRNTLPDEASLGDVVA